MDNRLENQADNKAEYEPNAYGIIAEFPDQAPILMEAEGDGSSMESTLDRAARLRGVIRWQIVRLVPTKLGNQLLLKDLVRMQK